MARSTYIYVVIDPSDGMPEATFTVKWEMEKWLEKHSGDYAIWRFGDGIRQGPAILYQEVRNGVMVTDNSGRKG